MRKLTIALSVATGFMATPALACPMMTQASAQTGATAASGMTCGRPMTTAQAQSQPGQSTQEATQPGQQAAGGCPCCRNMAMMQPQPRQSMPGTGDMHHMPGMQMPSAPATPAPEAPKQ
jgi:hypothetical protein